jgi:hypothetical protein
MLISGVVIAVSSYFIFARITTQSRALMFASFVSVSGTVLLAAGPVQSDGVALALAISALALALRHSPSATGTLLIGLLLGAAISVKSLHVVPIILTVVALLVGRQDWKRLGAISAVATMVIIGSSALYGIEEVWDQYVLFHLAKDNSPNLLDNTVNTGAEMIRIDLPVLAVLAAAILAPFLFRKASDSSGIESHEDHDVPRWIIVFWLVANVFVLFGFTTIYGGFARTLAFLIPPLLAFAATSRAIPIRVLLGIAVVGAIVQISSIDIVPDLDPDQLAATDQIGSIPADMWFVSDDPGLGWAAGRLSHPDTVDPSFARFETGYLTSSDVARALDDPNSCILTATSGRFDSADVGPPVDYLPTDDAGVYLRSDC